MVLVPQTVPTAAIHWAHCEPHSVTILRKNNDAKLYDVSTNAVRLEYKARGSMFKP